ncbi:MFS transporter [Novosphingobium cyanobacteriorum]|uniref:MFS transporter n=1 Tax=Novosphingobium cyanobacteriorum TaxID=3024215 RepID=A0ABT6CGJ3_9SPHN|nr:MFS transporter [Novosphingobium cyanobacteriorum]MDF8332896.1 MFS transporter [Novosphingobium cyanobacteriorum]
MVTAEQQRSGAGSTTALVGLLALAMLLNFVDRGALGLAAPRMQADLGLTATQFGVAASAFFWTYGLLQPLLGWVGDRFRVYLVLACGLGLWALATMLMGWANGLLALVLLRLLLGFGESFVFPCTSKIIALHVPVERRGIANAVVAVGLALGPAAGTLAGGAILAQHGWRPVFITFGAITLAWLVPWLWLVRRLPPVPQASGQASFTYTRLLRQKALWLTGLCHITANYSFFFISIWLPLYLVKARGLPIGTMAGLVATVFAVQAVASLLIGQVSDRMVRSGASEDAVRRWFSVGGQVALAIGITGIAFAQGQAALTAWLVFTGAALAPGPTMVFAIGQMFAGPRLSGSWIGWQNAIGSLSGVIGPIVTGGIVDRSGGYGWAFAFAAGISLLGAALFAWVLPPIRQIEID